eukprot:2882803-Amphidinium_carterae.1
MSVQTSGGPAVGGALRARVPVAVRGFPLDGTRSAIDASLGRACRRSAGAAILRGVATPRH